MMSKITYPSGGLKFEGIIFDSLSPEARQELEIEKQEFFHGKRKVIIQEGSFFSGKEGRLLLGRKAGYKLSKLGFDDRLG